MLPVRSDSTAERAMRKELRYHRRACFIITPIFCLLLVAAIVLFSVDLALVQQQETPPSPPSPSTLPPSPSPGADSPSPLGEVPSSIPPPSAVVPTPNMNPCGCSGPLNPGGNYPFTLCPGGYYCPNGQVCGETADPGCIACPCVGNVSETPDFDACLIRPNFFTWCDVISQNCFASCPPTPVPSPTPPMFVSPSDVPPSLAPPSPSPSPMPVPTPALPACYCNGTSQGTTPADAIDCGNGMFCTTGQTCSNTFSPCSACQCPFPFLPLNIPMRPCFGGQMYCPNVNDIPGDCPLDAECPLLATPAPSPTL